MKRKKLTALLLAVALIAVLLTGCMTTEQTKPQDTQASSEVTSQTTQEVTNEPEEPSLINYDGIFPVTNEPTELEFLILFDSTLSGEFEELWWWNYMKEQSNVTIVPRLIATEIWNEQKAIILASGNLPDVFFRGWNADEIVSYGMNDKVFIPMTQYIANTELTPNINKAFEEYPDAKAASILPDGEIYGLPFIHSEYYETASGHKVQWLTDWLEKAGVNGEDIITLDDFYNALSTCRDYDYNGNGQADEIGWSFYWGNDGKYGMFGVVSYILGAYGFVTGDALIAVNSRTGDACYAPYTDEYKLAVEYIHKLYTDGLLDNDIFSMTDSDMKAKYVSGIVAFSTYSNCSAVLPDGVWAAHKESGYDGSVLYTSKPIVDSAGNSPVVRGDYGIGLNQITITKDCEIPEVAMRWFDACFDPVISCYYRIGPEYGTDIDPDGIGWTFDHETTNCNWSEALAAHGLDIRSWEWTQKYVNSAASVGYVGFDEFPGMIMLHPDTLTKAAPDWLTPYRTNVNEYEVLGYPTVYYTQDQLNIIEKYQSALDEYAIQMTAKFISGTESLDNWNSFIEGLENLNVGEYNDLLYSSYETYKANK